jgi:cytochrome c oxidase subunit 4
MISAAFPKTVLWTGIALLALWAASFGLSYVSLGDASLVVALAIAAVKAGLVAMFFMELLHESFSMKLAILSAGALLALLIGLMIADIVTRDTPPLLPFGTPPGTS